MFQVSECNIPPYQHWWQMRDLALAVKLTPQPRPFEGANTNNGKAWPEDMPNIWISDPRQPLPQAVELDFGKKVSFNTVLVSFDTDLDATEAKRRPFWRAPQCARDWRLYARVGGAWQMVYEETGNFQRRRVARFGHLTADALKLEILATNATEPLPSPSREPRLHGYVARVYEIRVYDE